MCLPDKYPQFLKGRSQAGHFWLIEMCEMEKLSANSYTDLLFLSCINLLMPLTPFLSDI